jgi:hypothetical protein
MAWALLAPISTRTHATSADFATAACWAARRRPAISRVVFCTRRSITTRW